MSKGNQPSVCSVSRMLLLCYQLRKLYMCCSCVLTHAVQSFAANEAKLRHVVDTFKLL